MKRIKKISILIFLIGIITIILFLSFLNRKNFNLNRTSISKTVISPTSTDNQIADVIYSTTASNSSTVEMKSSESNFQSQSVNKEIKDRPGQLVHHLFNIESVPSPKGLLFSRDNKEIWVALLLNQKRGAVVFDFITGEKIKDIDLAGGGGVEMIFSKDGSKVYISQMETAQVFEINTQTKEILRTLDTKSAWTKVLELSKDGKILFASNWSGNDVSEINLETGKVLRLLPTVRTPRGLYATENGNYLYVAGFDKGEIQKIDLKTGTGKIIFKSNGAMRHIVADEGKGVLFVSDMGKNIVWQVSLVNDEVKKFVDTDYNPNTIALSPDKKVLFISCRGINYSAENYYIPGPEWGSVLLFDTENGKILDAIVGGNQPTALDISSDGKLLVFSDFLDNRLEVFEVPSYDILKQGNGGRSQVYKSELKK